MTFQVVLVGGYEVSVSGCRFVLPIKYRRLPQWISTPLFMHLLSLLRWRTHTPTLLLLLEGTTKPHRVYTLLRSLTQQIHYPASDALPSSRCDLGF